MNIITISREFGSGGRELGKRLAESLGYKYYDREIITEIAKSEDLDENYVEWMLEEQSWNSIPYSFGHSFSESAVFQPPQVNLMQAQRTVIENIAKAGKDCVIVGRNADLFLADYKPLRLFVCAELESRVDRCMARAEEGEGLSRKDMEKNIKSIDKNRANTREIISSKSWGDGTSYDMVINTTEKEIKDIVPAVAAFAKEWFK